MLSHFELVAQNKSYLHVMIIMKICTWKIVVNFCAFFRNVLTESVIGRPLYIVHPVFACCVKSKSKLTATVISVLRTKFASFVPLIRLLQCFRRSRKEVVFAY